HSGSRRSWWSASGSRSPSGCWEERRHELAGMLVGAGARGASRQGVPRAAGRAVPAPQRRSVHLPRARVRDRRPRARGLAPDRAQAPRAAAPARGPSPAARPAEAARMTKREWLGRYRNDPKRPVRFSTVSDMELEPLYTAEDTPLEPERIGVPGEFPYTRGVYPSMYRGRLWTMRQFAGFGTAEDTNERFRFLLAQGQTGLSTAFDMPTLMGYDADHPRARGEVGREGVAVSSLVDVRALFKDIRLDRVTTSMTVNCTASAVLAMYLAVAEEQGTPWTALGGTIQNDMLKEFIAQKEWICPPEPSLRIVVDMIEFCARAVPRWHAVSISGYHIREAGSTAVQELAGVLGGVQSLHTNSLDETLALPSEQAAMVALRTQQILAEESGVTNTIDPLGGSWAVEALTDRIEREARAYIEHIDGLGGMVRAIELGYPQKEIAEAAYIYQQQVDRGEKAVVGVNRYQVPEERPLELLRVPLEVEERQAERVRRVKRERNGAQAREALGRVRAAAESGENLMPPVIAAVKALCTVGEIADVYRDVFGVYRDPAWL